MQGKEDVGPAARPRGAQLLRLAKELAPLSGLGLLVLGILGWFHYEITRLDSRMDLLNQQMTTEIQNLRQDLQTEMRDVRNDLQTEMRDVREEVRGHREETRQGFQALNERLGRLLLAHTGAWVVPAAPGRTDGESSP